MIYAEDGDEPKEAKFGFESSNISSATKIQPESNKINQRRRGNVMDLKKTEGYVNTQNEIKTKLTRQSLQNFKKEMRRRK